MNTQLACPIHILLGIDGSEHSIAAVQLLLDLPLARATLPTSRITVLAVLQPRQSARRQALEAMLQQVHEQLSRRGLEVYIDLIHGDPAGEIVRYAEEHDPTLIVLGALGLRATLGILLGGVAQHVVEYARWPVLTVRAPYRGLRRILLVTDGSPSSQKAIGYLCGRSDTPCLPIPADTVLHLAHVLPPLIQPEIYVRTWPIAAEALPYVANQEFEEISRRQAEEEEMAGRQLLEKTAETLQDALKDTLIKIEIALLRGDAATEIIQYAKTNQIDLIIAGSRGLSQVKSWLLGSVSRKLVHYAGCSTLIVK